MNLNKFSIKLVYNQQEVHKKNAAWIINSIMMNDRIVIYGHSSRVVQLN